MMTVLYSDKSILFWVLRKTGLSYTTAAIEVTDEDRLWSPMIDDLKLISKRVSVVKEFNCLVAQFAFGKNGTL